MGQDACMGRGVYVGVSVGIHTSKVKSNKILDPKNFERFKKEIGLGLVRT
jgi:hypothetical protein